VTAFVVRNTSELVLPEASGRGVTRVPDGAFVVRDDRVAWVGPASALPEDTRALPVFDAERRAVLPALVDAHTHLVYAGERIQDFALRAEGTSYAESAARGGGILTTMTATRAAAVDALADDLRARLAHRARYGITTTEVKSGYGLTVEHELRMLEAIALVRRDGHDLEPTLLAAHALPRDRPREAWVADIVDILVPTVAARGLARFVDAFVEKTAYTLDEARRVFAAARAHGLGLRIHADQLTAGGGTALAAELGAASADHLEYATDADFAALARAGTVAVLLPGALTFLGDDGRGLGARLRAAGAELAIATDHNPGSSPLHNLPLAATLAVTTMGLHVDEALRAITLGGARALRRDDVGHLGFGARARWLVLEHADARALVYAFGEPVVRGVFAPDLEAASVLPRATSARLDARPRA
jgi:imidazolonepropionase